MTTHVISYCGTPQTALLAWIIASGAGADVRVFRSNEAYVSFLRKHNPVLEDVHLVLVCKSLSGQVREQIERYRHVTRYVPFSEDTLTVWSSKGVEEKPIRKGPVTSVYRPEVHQIETAWEGYHKGISMPPFVQLAIEETNQRYVAIVRVVHRLLRRWIANNNRREDIMPFLETLFGADEATLERFEFAGTMVDEFRKEWARLRCETSQPRLFCGLSIPTVNAEPSPIIGRALVSAHGIGCAFSIRGDRVIGRIYMNPPAYQLFKEETFKQNLPNCDLPLPWRPDATYVDIIFEFPYEGNESRFPLK